MDSKLFHIQTGEKALKRYYSWMRIFYPNSFKYSWEQFYEILKKIKAGKTLAEGLGLGITESNLSDSRIDDSMKSLAKYGGGKIPASQMDFFNYLIIESRKINLVDAASFVFVESLKDGVGGLEAFGGSLLTSLKALNAVLPIVLIGGTLFFVLSRLNGATGGDLANAIKSMKK